VARAQSQPQDCKAAFRKMPNAFEKFNRTRARLWAGKYDWSPLRAFAPSRRLQPDRFKENGLLAGVLSGTPNTGHAAPITDRRKCRKL